MSKFFDPVPIIERAVPRKFGQALSGGAHGDTITVRWNGKEVQAEVKGPVVSAAEAVNVVNIAGRFFAISSIGEYHSNEPKKLSSWSRKAPFSAAIRKIMDKNPRRKKYEFGLVSSYSVDDSVAFMASGEYLPVGFSPAIPNPDMGVEPGEIALISSRPFRHCVGGKRLSPTGGSFSYIDFGFINANQFTITNYLRIRGFRVFHLLSNSSTISFFNIDRSLTIDFDTQRVQRWAEENPGFVIGYYQIFNPSPIIEWCFQDFSPWTNTWILIPPGTYRFLIDGVFRPGVGVGTNFDISGDYYA